MSQSPKTPVPRSSALIPCTPGPLYSPPERRSSLAFRSLHPAPPAPPDDVQPQISPNLYQPNIGGKTVLASPIADDALPTQARHIQKILLTAKANLHRDMFAASSPASSIESRMRLDHDSPLPPISAERSEVEHSKAEWHDKDWRYSTAPLSLAAVSVDVREPLPSPTLPKILLQALPDHEADCDAEPASSGFRPPIQRYSDLEIAEAMATVLPMSEPESIEGEPGCISALLASDSSDLDSRIVRLDFSRETASPPAAPSVLEESPVISHLRRRPGGISMENLAGNSPPREIYLSPNAEAAATSAKAKRKLLRDTQTNDRENARCGISHKELASPDLCNHRLSSMTLCPDPSAHRMDPALLPRPTSATISRMLTLDQPSYSRGPMGATFSASRATSTGSPMPFARTRARSGTPSQDAYAYPELPRSGNPHMLTMREHFQPGWYYSQEPAEAIRSAPCATYSFSTAASKFTGSDQAPDSRIRDSYKTDTLTALAKPPHRFRKNGLGAEVAPRGVGRYYQRPQPSLRPSSARTGTDSRQTHRSGNDVRFRSSPPPGPGPEYSFPLRRKRATDDSFVIDDDQYVGQDTAISAPRIGQSNEMMEVDEQTKAAVRMSIFGSHTPEALRHARQGIRELSPNVQVYRKSVQEHGHLRKKRRPSCWDNDLQEIRESPAGRGGVNSPVSAQASMRAEFDIASIQMTEMDVDSC